MHEETIPTVETVLLREQRTLPVKLTGEEFTDRARQLAKVNQDIAAEEARANDVKQQLKARLTQLEARRTELSSVVERNEEMRQVEVNVFAHFESGKAYTVRMDTSEILDSRPLTEKERQSHLPLEPEPAPGTLAEQVDAAARRQDEHERYLKGELPDPRD